jgi:hypothetical protein
MKMTTRDHDHRECLTHAIDEMDLSDLNDEQREAMEKAIYTRSGYVPKVEWADGDEVGQRRRTNHHHDEPAEKKASPGWQYEKPSD